MSASRIRAVVVWRRCGVALRLARVAEEGDLVAPPLLRPVHRLVGGDQHRLGADPLLAAEHRDADADRRRLGVGGRLDALGDLGAQVLAELQRPLDVGLRHQDRELVAGEAGDDVGGAHPFAHHLGDLADQVVAGVVAERVVDRLEAVDVDDHHRALAAVAGAEGDVLVELGAEAAAVEQPGQRVVVGQVAQLGLGPLGPLQRRRERPRGPPARAFSARPRSPARSERGVVRSSLEEGRTIRADRLLGQALDFLDCDPVSATPDRPIVGLHSSAGSVRAWPTAWRRRPAPTCSSTATTRSTGTRGARRRWRGRASEDRPILLSVGYSACHWCHVMERESFEDAETAAYMNEHFVSVKVDREERPDVDAIYMEAVQAMSGQGGWPMTVFLRPRRRALLRRHLLPARREPRDAELPHGDGSGRRRLREPPRGDPRAGAADAGAAGRDRRDRARRRGARARSCSRRRSQTLRAAADMRARRLRRRAEVPARLGAGAAARPRRDASRSSGRSTRCWPAASTTRSAAASPATRSTPPGSSPTSRRCSTTTRCWRAPTCTAGRRSATSATGASARRRSTGRCARCAAPRAASTRRSTPTPRARRAASTSGRRSEIRERRAGRRAPTRSSTTTGSARRATSRAATSSTWPAAPRRPSRTGSPRRAGRSTRRARKRVWPGLDDKRLAAWNALMIARAGRGRRGARARATTSTRPRELRRVRAGATCATPTGACCAPTRTARRRLNAYLEDHAFLLEALLTLYEATFEPRWFERGRRRSPTR